MKIDRDRFLEEGYLTVREAIPPSQLEGVREAYELLVSHQREIWARERKPDDPPGGEWEIARQPRLHLNAISPRLTGLLDRIDGGTIKAIEAWMFENIHGVSSELLGVADAAVTDMMLMCNPVRDHGPAKWHRDMYPPTTAPVQGYCNDILEGGPRYVQWNISLYNDDVLCVIPGSHIRPNAPEEDARIAADPHQALPNLVRTDLKAGDGVVYILPILHWGSNYTTTKRRCIHGGFSTFTRHPDLRFTEFLPPERREMFRRWTQRSETMKDCTEAAMRAFANRDSKGYQDALDQLHPGRGPKGRDLSTVYLSKAVGWINDLKTDADTPREPSRNQKPRAHPITLYWGEEFADRFSRDEARRMWDRFSQVDELMREETLQYAPGFQGRESYYQFIDMPDSDAFDELIGD